MPLTTPPSYGIISWVGHLETDLSLGLERSQTELVAMNLETAPSVEDLADLLAACNDGAGDHLLWVDKNATVHIDFFPHGFDLLDWMRENSEAMQFRLDLCLRGNGYTGAQAAEHRDHLERTYQGLLGLWARRAKGHVDCF